MICYFAIKRIIISQFHFFFNFRYPPSVRQDSGFSTQAVDIKKLAGEKKKKKEEEGEEKEEIEEVKYKVHTYYMKEYASDQSWIYVADLSQMNLRIYD